MPNFNVLEPAIDPNNRISFLLDWELTMKCNLDCTYCNSWLYGGHDNSTKHPPIDECIKSIDFMFKYVDQYMEYRPKGLKYVILNIYGGESLHHPDIVQILSEVRQQYKPYQDRWHLTVTTTTNAIVPQNKMTDIISLIDEFTVSYHTECTDKQKAQFKENLLLIKQSNRRLKCIVLMHNDPEKFNECQSMIEWLEQHEIKILPRQLDGGEDRSFEYNPQQITWFNNLYQNKSHNVNEEIKVLNKDSVALNEVGRACCGGRQTCKDQNYQQRHFFVQDNCFTDWYCSVNWFFVYIKQVTKEVFVNKDCKMNFQGQVGPIGSLTQSEDLLNNLKNQLTTSTLPVIQCKKSLCMCGLCAPKASNLNTYQTIIKKYQKGYTT